MTSIPVSKAKRVLEKAYEIQVRRGGKFTTLPGETLPLGQALRLGTKKTISTLAATFRLKEKGTTTKKDISFKVPGKSFRKPKSGEALTFVERKQLRIKKGSGEIGEILGIRKRKPRTSKKKRRR